jgi:DNA gyrase subunit B
MDTHETAATAIVGKALEASRARAAARKASERARYQSIDQVVSKEVYKQQFGIRSKNWHQSAAWITDDGILSTQADMWDGPDDAKVLDVCCGSGVVGNAFRGKVGHITGLDLTPEMIAKAETRLDIVHQGDVYDMPFEDNQFDLVCNREVLHLLPRPDIPVSQIFRVLKSGGTFIVSQLVLYGPEDAPWFFRIVKKKQPLFFNNLMAEDMVKLLEDAGFVDITMKELVCWEDIDVWIDTWETPNLHRHEIRQLYYDAPAEVRRVHPFEIRPDGGILDQWRWVVLRGRKPSA